MVERGGIKGRRCNTGVALNMMLSGRVGLELNEMKAVVGDLPKVSGY
jgi:hypothetical protein